MAIRSTLFVIGCACAPFAGTGYSQQTLDEAFASALAEDYYECVQVVSSSGTTEPTWQAPNRGRGLRTSFNASSVIVRPWAHAEWAWGLELSRLQRDGHVLEIAEPELRVQGNRAEYRRGSLIEWYRNDERGLEHGFTLKERPSGTGAIEIRVDIHGGLIALDEPDEQRIAFVDEAGEAQLFYTYPIAFDAEARALPVTLTPIGSTLRYLLDDEGATYPVTIDPVIFTEDQEISFPDPLNLPGLTPKAEFGTAISSTYIGCPPGDSCGAPFDSVLVAIGAPHADDTTFNGTPDTGAVYIFRELASGWSLEARIQSAVPPNTGDQFGASVDISENLLVVGSPGRDVAQVFRLRTNPVPVWFFSETFSGTAGTEFGAAVAIESLFDDQGIGNDDVIVGAPGEQNGGGLSTGAVHRFVRSALDTWTQPASNVWFGGVANARFGSGVAHTMSTAFPGDAVLVTAPGSTRVYLIPEAPITTGAPPWSPFWIGIPGLGSSVDAVGDLVVVGAPTNSTIGLNAGAVAVMSISSTGSPLQVPQGLASSDIEVGDSFGTSVSLAPDAAHLMVGAPGESTRTGAGYLFEAISTAPYEFSEIARFEAAGGAADDLFGIAVHVRGDDAFAGAIGRTGGVGTCYHFDVPVTPLAIPMCVGDSAVCTTCSTSVASRTSSQGCLNSTGIGGRLFATGSSSVSADDVAFTVSGLPANEGAFLYVSDAIDPSGGCFGEGLRCLDGSPVQIAAALVDANGDATFGPGLLSAAPSSPPSYPWSAGQTRHFIVMYRDGATFNTTNALEITFGP